MLSLGRKAFAALGLGLVGAAAVLSGCSPPVSDTGESGPDPCQVCLPPIPTGRVMVFRSTGLGWSPATYVRRGERIRVVLELRLARGDWLQGPVKLSAVARGAGLRKPIVSELAMQRLVKAPRMRRFAAVLRVPTSAHVGYLDFTVPVTNSSVRTVLSKSVRVVPPGAPLP